MKTTALPLTFALTLFLFTSISYSQDDTYTQTMLATIEKLDQSSTSETFLECSSLFERIAAAEESRWLPYYYGAYSLIAMSFSEPDPVKKDQVLERAQQILDRAFALNPDESELHALQAFLYPSWVTVDPMGRGMRYIEKMGKSLEKAKAANPGNPRALFLEAIHKQNLPPSMGGGAEIARPIFVEAADQFTRFHSDDPLWPDWGEDANSAALQNLQ